MDHADPGEQIEDARHLGEEVLHDPRAVPELVVEGGVPHLVDSFAFEELALHFEEALVEVLPPTHLVHQPHVLPVLDEVQQLRHMLSPLSLGVAFDHVRHLHFDEGGGVELVVGLGELLHGHVLAPLGPQPHQRDPSFSQELVLLVALGAAVPIGGLVGIAEEYFFLGLTQLLVLHLPSLPPDLVLRRQRGDQVGAVLEE
mmetsp:Transcript_32068/g.31368  ORF Transcript_32068/g.31368 Transcript_32068/m.31368 type:complete len:200 (+) Transcript_32068:636-1235(+)